MKDLNFLFFIDNQQKLSEEFPRKYLLIHNESIEAVLDSYEEAFLYAQRHGLSKGSYLIQQSSEELDEVAEVFYSHNLSFK